MNDKDFVTLEQAIKLRELGFKERCYQFYDCAGTLCDNFKYFHGEDAIITSDNFCISHNSSQKEDIWDAPTLAQAQKWLRNGKGLSVEPFTSLKKEKQTFEIIYVETGFEYNSSKTSSYILDSYEEALSVGIDYAIKLLEK